MTGEIDVWRLILICVGLAVLTVDWWPVSLLYAGLAAWFLRAAYRVDP